MAREIPLGPAAIITWGMYVKRFNSPISLIALFVMSFQVVIKRVMSRTFEQEKYNERKNYQRQLRFGFN